MRRVLVVDDSEGLLEALREVLEHVGLEIEIARNADEAVRHLDERCFDAVLSDVVMAGNGFGLLEKVKASHAQTPVILMSGVGSRETKARAGQSGAFEYLAKPVPRAELLAVLERAFQRSRHSP